MKRLRIAQVAPPWLPVPPQGYGGIEIMVYHLARFLVAAGHEVTLFASGESRVAGAKLSFVYEKALGNDGSLKKNPYRILLHITSAFARAAEFDLIHAHVGGQACFLANLVTTPVVHTLHGAIGPADLSPEARATYQLFRQQRFVSISHNQRLGMPELNYVGTVYNGIDLGQFRVGGGEGGYLAWLGRITPKKGVVEAIEAAKAAGLPLKIAAFVDPIDQPFFAEVVKPKLSQPGIEFLGSLTQEERSEFLEKARCLLFPIAWEEPFGLVMVEAMACGTPVVAFNRGSVPEVVKDGVTGFIVEPSGEVAGPVGGAAQNAASPRAASTSSAPNWIIKKRSIEGLVEAIRRIGEIDRSACRHHVEQNFTVERMVEGYARIYQELAK